MVRQDLSQPRLRWRSGTWQQRDRPDMDIRVASTISVFLHRVRHRADHVDEISDDGYGVTVGAGLDEPAEVRQR